MSARDVINSIIDDSHGADMSVLPQDLWDAFLTETGLTPQPTPEAPHDQFVMYRDHELRRSAVC